MMKSLIFILLGFNCFPLFLSAQITNQSKFKVDLQFVVTENLTSDRLLNYYEYSNLSFFPLFFTITYSKSKSQISLNINYDESKLNPVNLNSKFYSYNLMSQTDLKINLNYLYNVFIFSKFKIKVGFSNFSNLNIQEVKFKNYLYNSSDEIRKSFDLSLITLSSSLAIEYQSYKSSFEFFSAYGLLSLSSRPNQSYVSSLQTQDGFDYRFYNSNKINTFLFSFVYRLSLTPKIEFLASYSFYHKKYLSEYNKNDFRENYGIGLSKTF